MHSLASYVNEELSMKNKILWMASQSRKRLPDNSYSAKMYDYVKRNYDTGIEWEITRDMIYKRYIWQTQPILPDIYYKQLKKMYSKVKSNTKTKKDINTLPSVITYLAN